MRVHFKFVVGIIQITKTINYKDKITLGIVYCLFKKMNINFYIDKIYFNSKINI